MCEGKIELHLAPGAQHVRSVPAVIGLVAAAAKLLTALHAVVIMILRERRPGAIGTQARRYFLEKQRHRTPH